MSDVSGNGPDGAGEFEAAGMAARVRLMMLVSALTTLIAIAAVIGVISYRVFHSGAASMEADGVITLPKGARMISMSASDGRVAILLDVGGGSELRTFDIKTLKQIGRLRFATEP